jgi:hypothetical protein
MGFLGHSEAVNKLLPVDTKGEDISDATAQRL